jgi:CBS domain-containing protein
VYALRAASTAVSTRSRIAAAEEQGVLDDATAADLLDALELLSYWRLRQQARQIREGARPDNSIAPAELTEHQRRHLKDAFGIIRSVQQQMAHRLGPVYS